MSYTINLTNGTTLIPGGLSDGTVDTTHSSLSLIGRDYPGYGVFLNENFVYLLENFSNNVAPATPLKGQLWWDSANSVLRVYTGNSWKITNGATSAPASSPPTDLSALGGDLWWDSTNNQLKIYNGSLWITVGPVATPATGNSGAQPALINDTSGGTHVVIEMVIRGTVYALFAFENFSSTLAGFTTIVAGLNFTGGAQSSLALNTQSVSATPSTLVQRDTQSGITVNNISAQAVSASGAIASAISVTAPSFVGTLNGNVNATTVTTTGNITTPQYVSASSGFIGPIITPTQTLITQLGSLNSLTVSGTTTLVGKTTYQGVEIAVKGGEAPYQYVDAVIGLNTPNVATFTTATINTAMVPGANTSISLGGSSGQWWNEVYTKDIKAVTASIGAATFGSITSGPINVGAATVASMATSGTVQITNATQNNGSGYNSGALTVAGDIGVGGKIWVAGSGTFASLSLGTGTLSAGAGSFTGVVSTTSTGGMSASLGAFTTLNSNYINPPSSGTLAITATSVTATSGVYGTLQTAAQTNITSVGTLTSLSVSGSATAASYSGAGTGLTGTGSSFTAGQSNALYSPSTSNYQAAYIPGNAYTIAQRDSGGGLTASIFNGKATSAEYADLAEKYLADAEYEVGTVLMVGGDKEVTACQTGYHAIGPVSGAPAYMMNSGLEGGTYIALKGRVPVKVTGPVTKGQKIVAGPNGTGEPAIANEDYFAFALESNSNPDVKIVECLVV